MFEIYGTTDCAYCDRAKILLAMKEKEYTFIDVMKMKILLPHFLGSFRM